MKRLWILLLLLLGAATLRAQDVQLSLEDCLSYCEDGNRDLKNADLRVVGAKAQRAEARWEYFPRVSVNAVAYDAFHPLLKITLRDVLGNSDAANNLNAYITDFARQNGIKPYFETLEYGYGASVVLTQPIYAGGRIINGNRLASLGVEAARLQADMTVKAVRDSVESKYWKVVALQEKRHILDETLGLLDMLEKDLSSALAAGLVTDEDLLQVRLKRSETEALSRRLNGGLGLAKMDLLDQIGYPYSYLDLPGIRLTEDLGQAPAPETVLMDDPDMTRTPESRLLEMQVQARKLEKKMAVGEFLPQVAVGATYGYNALIQPGTRKSPNGLVFAMVKIPLTDIGKAVARSRRYGALVQMAENDRDYLNDRLRLLEQMLRLELTTAWDEMQVREEAVEYAQKALERMQARYRAGQVTASALARTTVELSAAQDQLIGARIAYRKAVNAYYTKTK